MQLDSRDPELPAFTVPDIASWEVRRGPAWVPRAGIPATFMLEVWFLYLYRTPLESGGYVAGCVALASLALAFFGIVLVHRHASSTETRRDIPPEPRSRSPDAGTTRRTTKPNRRCKPGRSGEKGAGLLRRTGTR